MGHDEWMTWAIDEARGGPRSRVQAERTYCLALFDVYQAWLKRQPKKEQKFYDDARSLFADAAKTAFTIGISVSGGNEGWEMPIAKSSTAINETLWRFSQGPYGGGKNIDITPYLEKIEEQILAQKPSELDHYRRLRSLLRRIEKHFANRPAGELEIARQFSLQMAQLTLLRPAVEIDSQS